MSTLNPANENGVYTKFFTHSDYFGIDHSIVWEIKISYLPDLILKLQSLAK